jgi:hypothetical protein
MYHALDLNPGHAARVGKAAWEGEGFGTITFQRWMKL